MKTPSILKCLLLFAAITLGGCGTDEPPIPAGKVTLPSTQSDPVLSETGGRATFAFNATAAWTADCVDTRASSWVTVSPTSGDAGDVTLNINAEANTTYDERRATVTITCGTESKTFEITQKQVDALTVTTSRFDIGAEENSIEIEVKANIDFDYQTDCDWLVYRGTRAMKTSTLSFTVAANDDVTKREGTIRIISGDKREDIKIYQAGGKPSIVISQTDYTVSDAGETIRVEVHSNVDYSLQMPSVSWITENKTRSVSTGTHYFVVAANSTYDPREAEIVFSSTDGTLSDRVHVVQVQKDAIIVADNHYTTAAEGGALDFTVQANVAIEVSTTAEWITRVATRAMTDRNLFFDIAANSTYDDRQGEIVIRSGAIEQRIGVTQQAAKAMMVLANDSYTIMHTERTMEFEIKTNTPFSIGTDVDWIEPVGTRALESKYASFRIVANRSDDGRTGHIVFESDAAGAKQTVTIVQLGANTVYIPDETFRAYCIAVFDSDKNGELSVAECEAAFMINYPGSDKNNRTAIKSIEGIGYFKNISYLYLSYGQIQGEVDLSANTQLSICDIGSNYITSLKLPEGETLTSLYVHDNNLPAIDVSKSTKLQNLTVNYNPLTNIDVSHNSDLSYLRAVSCQQLSSLDLTANTALEFLDIPLTSVTHVTMPEGDYPLFACIVWSCPLLTSIDLSGAINVAHFQSGGSTALKEVWLRTGTSYDTFTYEPGAVFKFKGENLNEAINIPDDTFRSILLKKFDSNNDGIISKVEAMTQTTIQFEAGDIPENSTIASFEGIANFQNLSRIVIIGDARYRNRITAPLSEEFAQLQRLSYFQIEQTNMTGTISEKFGTLPRLSTFYCSNNKYITGTLPESLIKNRQTRHINVRDCQLGATIVEVPASELLNYPDRSKQKWIDYEPQDLNASSVNPGALLLYRCQSDGKGEIHADGEVETYQRASKGNGVNIIITGDGYTEANNTVGGTAEIVMRHAAETFFSIEPYKSLREYFNVYIIYAHSAVEGTGCGRSRDTKYQVSQYVTDTHMKGDNKTVLNAVTNAGLPLDNANISVIANSSIYGGTCYMYSQGYSIGYTPVSREFEKTLIHESGGHGFGKCDDEYRLEENGYISDDMKASRLDQYANLGWWGNIDFTNNPTEVHWAAFLADGRYADEHLGVFEGGATYPRGVWHSTYNSIMNIQWNPGGDVFNAPCREMIYKRTMKLAYGDSWTYDYQTFVTFDLARSRTEAPHYVQAPTPTTSSDLPQGVTYDRPRHTPPVVVE